MTDAKDLEAWADAPPGREASWHPVDDLPELALDHAAMVEDGLWRLGYRLQDKAWFIQVAGALLPEVFTLSDAQRLYEALRREAVDGANFSRDMRATGCLEPTGDTRREGPGRPAQLYRLAHA